MWALSAMPRIQCWMDRQGETLLSGVCSHLLFFWRKMHKCIKQLEGRKMEAMHRFGDRQDSTQYFDISKWETTSLLSYIVLNHNKNIF